MPPLDARVAGKKLRNEALSARALGDLQTWIDDRASQGLPALSRA
jgi:folate-dependent tRNA-U54 methylase TrmFO/GidA